MGNAIILNTPLECRIGIFNIVTRTNKGDMDRVRLYFYGIDQHFISRLIVVIGCKVSRKEMGPFDLGRQLEGWLGTLGPQSRDWLIGR